MIRVDEGDFIVDTVNGDGMDSANRAGVSGVFNVRRKREPLEAYEKDGLCVRHPESEVLGANNPWNFTRDQLSTYVAGLWKQGQYKTVRRIFWAHFKRGFFCQNFERDKPGSKKYLWPHVFFKDSNPDATTVLKKFNIRSWSFSWHIPIPDMPENDPLIIEQRNLDFADPLMPNDIWHLVLCGRMWYFYPLAPLGYLFTYLAILGHCKNNTGDDEAQIICQAKVAGKFFVKLYTKKRKDWEQKLINYWHTVRQMGEFAAAIILDFHYATEE